MSTVLELEPSPWTPFYAIYHYYSHCSMLRIIHGDDRLNQTHVHKVLATITANSPTLWHINNARLCSPYLKITDSDKEADHSNNFFILLSDSESNTKRTVEKKENSDNL